MTVATVLPIAAIASALAWTVALRAPDRVAPPVVSSAPPYPDPAVAPSPTQPTRPEPGDALAREVDIFEAVDVPHPTGVTTFALPQRGGEPAPAGADSDGVVVRTRCNDHGCVDGLFDRDKTLIDPQEAEADGEYGLERVVKVIDRSDRKVSVYLATSSVYRHAAHANNALECRTYSRDTGRRLRLRDVMPPRSAALVLAKVRALFDRRMEDGVPLPEVRVGAEDVSDQNFRVERLAGRDHVVLCVSSDDGDILEIRVDALPVAANASSSQG
jgi:hypothetical protein